MIRIRDIGIVFSALWASGAHAQEPVDTLKGVEVESRRIPAGNRTPNTVQVLAGEQLQRLNSLSVADAVKRFSGVQLTDYGGIGGLKTINVRNLGSNHTAVFYDGMQLNTAQNGQIDLGQFSLDNLEVIELYHGQMNDLFQPARGFSSASSLYLKAKRPEFQANRKTRGKLAFRTGSFGLVNPSVLWQQKLSERVSGSLSAEWMKASGKYRYRYTGNALYDTVATRHNADVDARRLEAGFYGSMADSSEWSVKLYGYDSERGLPGAVVAGRFGSADREWDRNVFVQTRYRKPVGLRYSMQLNARYSHAYIRYLDPQYQNSAGRLDNRYRQNEWYFSLANRYRPAPWWELVLSGDYIRNDLHTNIPHFALPVRHTGLFVLASGLKFNRLEIQGSLLATLVNESVNTRETPAEMRELTPSLALTWQPFQPASLRVRAFYKEAFRMPTFQDLYYTLIGSTDLRPEYTRQYNLGLTWLKTFSGVLQAVSLQADGYYNRVRDKITAIPSANLFRWTMVNLGKVEIRGLDVNIRTDWKPGGGAELSAGLNYTFQRSRDMTPGGYYYGQDVPYAPRHAGSAFIEAEWKAFGIYYHMIYTGSRYNLRPNLPENYMEAWDTHDLSVSWSTRAWNSRIKLMAEVNNVANRFYDVVRNYPMPGRSYRFSLNVNY